MAKTTNEVTEVIKNSKLDSLLSYLYDRWCCEKEYEDFADYAQAMERNFKNAEIPDATFIKATKRPFGFTFKFTDGKTFQLSVNATHIKLTEK